MRIERVIAVNRYGLGARPGEPEQTGSDPRGWLLSQVQGAVPLPAELRYLPGSAELLVSTLRALEFMPDRPAHALAPLRLLGQLPYMPGSPAGWPDRAADWGGSDAIMTRIEVIAALAARVGSRRDPMRIAEATLGPVLGEHSRTAIRRADSAAQGLTLLFMSPEFQRR